MTFPQYNSKHNEQALFSPRDFIEYKRWDSQGFPKKIVIVYQKSVFDYFRRKYSGKFENIKFVGLHQVLKYGEVGLIKMMGIGSPHAITVFEELIAIGAKEFISIGTAGGLQEQGIYLANRAIRDEGTSHHYIAHGKYSYPAKGLTSRLAKALKDKGIKFEKATTWTIDAPYRETKAEIAKYRKEGVATVEMEASALFAVAKVRGVKIASAFVVSDILGKKWEPNFHKLSVKRLLNLLLDASLSCLGGKKCN